MRLLLLLLAGAASTVLLYLFCYGGYGGPVDWMMDTVRHGSRDVRRIALTFDDGPDPMRTPKLLDALAELDVKGTFFVVGDRVDANPSLCARIAREGHEVGNHTYSHRYLPLAPARSVERELRATDRAIEGAIGRVPAIARPPYGGRSPWTVRAFARLAKRLVLWDVNSFDWKGKPPPEVAERVLERVKPGSIVLFHDTAADRTIETLRLVVPALRAQGYELVTVDKIG
jgi:peptidoglycan-N-acetylglucosamine deacetylase